MAGAVADRKGEIRRSALELLVSNGLTDWSIQGCSTRAGCAKGLVLHYFATKEALLTSVASTLVADRWKEWSGAFSTAGIGGLDALWDRLTQEAETRRARALLELRLAGVDGAALSPVEAAELRRRLAGALEIPANELPVAGALEHLLEGYLLALLRGVPNDEVKEVFFRYWLSYVR